VILFYSWNYLFILWLVHMCPRGRPTASTDAPTSIVGRGASHHAPPQRRPQLPWPILLFQMSDGDLHPRWWATTYPLQHVSCLGQASPPRAWLDKLWRCRANGLGDWVESTYYKTIERNFSWLLFTREGYLTCRDECSRVAGTGFIFYFSFMCDLLRWNRSMYWINKWQKMIG
jgi:hypothetical protein